MHPAHLRLSSALLIFPLAAHGTIVTTHLDEDDGSLGGGTGISLREAVKYSSTGDTITFDAALSGQTIRLTAGELLIAKSITVDAASLAERMILSGDKTGDGRTVDDTRVVQIAGGNVSLNALVITGGSGDDGGGVLVSGTTNVTISNSILTGNFASARGGAIHINSGVSTIVTIENCSIFGNISNDIGGGVSNYGTLTIKNSSVSDNFSLNSGGGIYNFAGYLTVESSNLSGNISKNGGGLLTGNYLRVTNSTLSGNSASSKGGGIYYPVGGSMIVMNSTLSGNSAATGGGLYSQNGGSVAFKNATIHGNTAVVSSGGIYYFGFPPYTFSLENSIVSGNAAPAAPDITGTFTGSNNLTSGDPRLAPLGDYGGPTQTMPPLPGSPAINTGGTTTLTTDQRALPRVGTPDIGAAEYQGTADLVRFWELDFDGDASPYGTEQALGTDPLISDPSSSRNITAPVLNASGHAVLSFGIGAAAPGTRWILSRSTDLLDFAEIYRYNGTTDTAASNVSYVRTSSSITVTDTAPLPGGGFYRFEAVLEP